MARYLTHDQFHQKALAGWKSLGEQGKKCYSSNFVLNETLTLLARRAGYKFACDRAKEIYASERLIILRSSEAEELKAVQYLDKYKDQKVSFTDCLSFVLMHNKGLRQVFGFDEHFIYAGFEYWNK